jgi:hypothetical protein
MLYNPTGKGVQRTPHVYPIFWGSNWFGSPGAEVRSSIMAFYNGLTNSEYQGILTQYFDGTANISPTVAVSAPFIDGSAATALTFTKVEEEVKKAVQANGWPVEFNSHFALFVSPGSTFDPSFAREEHLNFCAFHSYGANGAFTFVPYMGDPPFVNGCGSPGFTEGNNQATVADLAHEYAEAVTNPIPGETTSSWSAGGDGGEIADVCGYPNLFQMSSGAWVRSLYDNSVLACSHDHVNPPHVYTVTGSASGIAGSKAMVAGVLNAEGLASGWQFDYGTTTAYGAHSPTVSAPGTRTNQAVSAELTGLAQGTTYHYRLTAGNGSGGASGEDKEFRTASVPTVETGGSFGVTGDRALLRGSVNPNGVATTAKIEYGPTTSYGSSLSKSLPAEFAARTVEGTASALLPSTLYHYRVVAENEFGKSIGADRTFTTLTASAPIATTLAPGSVGVFNAQLVGSIARGNVDTKFFFEYGPTLSYGSKTATRTLQSDGGSSSVAEVVTGLEQGATYHYRLVASNVVGSSSGGDQTFTTVDQRPFAMTEAATGVTAHGSINPRFQAVKYQFEYGTTTAYGATVPVPAKALSQVNTFIAVSNGVSGLESGTTYHFRVAVVAPEGRVGEDMTFQTTPKPTVVAEPATFVASLEPALNASVAPNGAATQYQFEFGTTTSYGQKLPITAKAIGSGLSPVLVSETPSGLQRGTTYHYRVVAESEAGVTTGADRSFSTLPPCVGGGQCSWSSKVTPNPPPRTEDSISDVSCFSPTACTAVGYDGFKNDGFVELWNGAEWKIPAGPEAGGELEAVSCYAASTCMAVGKLPDGTMKAWQILEGQVEGAFGTLPMPAGSTKATLVSVSCSSKTECTAVGYYRNEASEWKPLVERWTSASKWVIQSAPMPAEGGGGSTAMTDVSCVSATSCTTAGWSGGKPTAERWNGSEWSLITPPNPTGSVSATLDSLSCSSATSCIAVGHFKEKTGHDKPLAERWNGTVWSQTTVPIPPESEGGADLYAVSCLSPNSCFAVGRRINKEEEVEPGLKMPTEERTVAETWNGTEWSAQTTPNPAGAKWSTFTTISCASSVSCVGLGTSYTNFLSAESLTLGEGWE